MFERTSSKMSSPVLSLASGVMVVYAVVRGGGLRVWVVC